MGTVECATLPPPPWPVVVQKTRLISPGQFSSFFSSVTLTTKVDAATLCSSVAQQRLLLALPLLSHPPRQQASSGKVSRIPLPTTLSHII